MTPPTEVVVASLERVRGRVAADLVALTKPRVVVMVLVTTVVGYYVALAGAPDYGRLVALMIGFLYAHGERPRDIFLGSRSIAGEARLGVPLTFVAVAIAVAVLASVQAFAPWLHTVDVNPLGNLIRSPRDAWLFALVVVVAGGIREELQRAFLLHRFEEMTYQRIARELGISVSAVEKHMMAALKALFLREGRDR